MLDKVSLLKTILSNKINGDNTTWKEYAEGTGKTPEQVRRLYRNFKDIHSSKGVWFKGMPIEPEWELAVEELLNKIKYPGMRVKSVWEMPGKDGNKVVYRAWKTEDNEESTDFVDEIEAKLNRIIKEKIRPVKLPKVKKTNQQLLKILTSDKHVGAATINALYGNDYSAEIFGKRLMETLVAVRELVALYGTFDRIDIIDLGDGVDGWNSKTTRGGHDLEQSLDNAEQFDFYVKYHKQLFDALVAGKFAKNYSFVCATNDNHAGKFMYITARCLEEYLNVKYPQIETDVNRKFLFHREYGVHKFIYTHGKDEKYMSRGFPKVLTPPTEKFIEEYIAYNGLNKTMHYTNEKHCITLYKGDTHITGEEYAKRFRYKHVMSMYGSSGYVQHNWGAGYRGFELEILDKHSPKRTSSKYFFNDK